MQYLEIISQGYGFIPYIKEIVNNKGKNETHKWYITIENFRKNYKEFANWEQYTEILVGNIDVNLKNKIKTIIKNHYIMGNSKKDVLIKIYSLINNDKVIFPKNEYDMQTAKILYDIIKEYV